jgi:hypothetical protein
MTTDSATAGSEGRHHIRRFRAAAIVVVAIGALLVAIAIVAGAPRLRPDEIVREFGAYDSPGNRFRVVVAESDQKAVTFTLVSPNPWKRLTTRLSHGRLMPGVEFEVERDWFFCFDQYDRLWVFVGRWDRDWGPLRQLPGGGTRPYPQAVTMLGIFFSGGSRPSGASVVSDTGEWKGVPPRFFAEIPEKEGSAVTVWGEIPPIPDEPPEFSPIEHSTAKSFWR